jgi:hypothetical protein
MVSKTWVAPPRRELAPICPPAPPSRCHTVIVLVTSCQEIETRMCLTRPPHSCYAKTVKKQFPITSPAEYGQKQLEDSGMDAWWSPPAFKRLLRYWGKVTDQITDDKPLTTVYQRTHFFLRTVRSYGIKRTWNLQELRERSI